jgi:hypothetical protein
MKYRRFRFHILFKISVKCVTSFDVGQIKRDEFECSANRLLIKPISSLINKRICQKM